MKTTELIKTISLNPSDLRELADLIEKSDIYSRFVYFDDEGEATDLNIYGIREENYSEKKARLKEVKKQKEEDKEFEEQQKKLIDDFLKANPNATMREEVTKLNYIGLARSLETEESRKILKDAMTEPINIKFYDENGNRLSWKCPEPAV